MSLGVALGAGASVAGSFISASKSAKEARKNRRFQERMSNTAYQRARADMKAAGLNPLLMASVGGASQPGGATAQVPDFGASLAKGASTAIQAMQAKAAINNTNANTAKTVKETELLGWKKPGAIVGETVGSAMESGLNTAKEYWEAGKALHNRMYGPGDTITPNWGNTKKKSDAYMKQWIKKRQGK